MVVVRRVGWLGRDKGRCGGWAVGAAHETPAKIGRGAAAEGCPLRATALCGTPQNPSEAAHLGGVVCATAETSSSAAARLRARGAAMAMAAAAGERRTGCAEGAAHAGRRAGAGSAWDGRRPGGGFRCCSWAPTYPPDEVSNG